MGYAFVSQSLRDALLRPNGRDLCGGCENAACLARSAVPVPLGAGFFVT